MKKELLRMDHVSQKYGGELLLDNLNFTMFAGEIKGLIFQNQKGRDRLIDLICYNHPISFGRVWYDGKIVNSYSFSDNSENRVCVIEQTSHLVEALTVVDNLFVMRKGFRKHLINESVLYDQAKRFLNENEIVVDIDKHVEDLTSLERCFLELAKALLSGCKLIIVDNPGTFLSQNELPEFQQMLRKIRKEGISVLYIGNHHEEVFRIADRTALFYKGQVRKIFDSDEMTDDHMAPYITDWQSLDQEVEHSHERGILRFRNVHAESLRGLWFVLNKGECLTILDVDNHIAEDIQKLMTGKLACSEGEIMIENKLYNVDCAARYLDEGVAVIPENPVESILFLEHSYMENLTFLLDRKLGKSLIPRKIYRSIRREYEPLTGKDIDVKIIRNLSWAKQLELVYYRMHLFRPKILICIKPLARGDMYCRNKILQLMQEMQRQNTAILIITAHLSDTLDISDRLLVVEDGVCTAAYEKHEFDRFL